MSPTSLANRATLRDRNARLRRVPLHRRVLATAARLPRRARAILALALLLLVWRFGAPHAAHSATHTQSPDHRRPPTSVKSVQFVLTQPRHPSARLRFANGAVQEVFLRAPPKDDSVMKPYEDVWEASEVVWVELPGGGVLRTQDEAGKMGLLEVREDGRCLGPSCREARRVRLELDVAVGLRALRDSDSSQSATLKFPSSLPVGPADVTLVTQFSISRLSRFERMLQAWDGPMSAAIYLVDVEDIRTLESHLSSPTLSPRWRRVALTIVKPDYSITEEALLSRLRYPINRLRNLALSLAPSPYTLVVDVDFVPSPNMHHILSFRAIPLLNQPSTRNSRSPTLRRTAIVIPTFALASSFTGPFPITIEELESLYTSVPQLASLTDANAGHGPTSPSRLFSSPAQSSSLSAIDPAWSYVVCYEPQWEPYYLLHRASHPLYDERFTDQGGDKQSHTLLLNALGYEFRVLRDVWVVHPPKTDRKEEEWPAARLVQRAGKADGSAADVQGAGAEEAGEDADDHFNLLAQRDETRFRYFQDFLPEMETAWGGNVRYPRGCAARVVADRWSFGKARAGTVFGL